MTNHETTSPILAPCPRCGGVDVTAMDGRLYCPCGWSMTLPPFQVNSAPGDVRVCFARPHVQSYAPTCHLNEGHPGPHEWEERHRFTPLQGNDLVCDICGCTLGKIWHD